MYFTVSCCCLFSVMCYCSRIIFSFALSVNSRYLRACHELDKKLVKKEEKNCIRFALMIRFQQMFLLIDKPSDGFITQVLHG